MPSSSGGSTTQALTFNNNNRHVALSSFAPHPFDTDAYFDGVEFDSEFDDWVQFDDEEFSVRDAFPAEDDRVARRMLQRQSEGRRERAERRVRASARLAGRGVRSSPDTLRLVAGAASDFATSLGIGLFNAAAPLALDPTAADGFRVAVFGALNNATIGALESPQPRSSVAKREQLAGFVFRNALVPAVLHRVVSVVVDNLINDAEVAEDAVLSSAAGLATEGHDLMAEVVQLLAAFPFSHHL
jgi:hypothetical protein